MARPNDSFASHAGETGDSNTGRLLLGEPSRAFDADVDYCPAVVRFVPAQVADEARLGTFLLRATSVQGANHRQHGEPRQDCYEFGINGDRSWLVVVVADGLSTAKYSHLGAAVAAETTRKCITDVESVSLDHIRSIPGRVEQELLRHYERFASEVATNLTFLAINTLDQVGYATRVGDGDVLVRRPEGSWRSVFSRHEPDTQTVQTSTYALPGGAAAAERARVPIEPNLVVAIGSDGITEPILTAQDVVGAAFWSELGRPPALVDYVRLVNFERRACFDDRTLVTLWSDTVERAP